MATTFMIDAVCDSKCMCDINFTSSTYLFFMSSGVEIGRITDAVIYVVNISKCKK